MSPKNGLEGYKYTPFPQDDSKGDYIRYLTLHAGSGDEPLQCTVHTAPMVHTEYEAVSYVWGSDVRDQMITCNGRQLPITTNLFRVLQRVRQPDAPRSIWADLICINQEDLDEKGYQVSIMGKIYRHANRVLIHMGGDDKGHGQKVRSLLETICTKIRQVLLMIPTDWNTYPYPDQGDSILTDSRWDSLRLLLEETWFTRGWVVREAGFAKDGQVYWGDSEFSWDDLMRTCAWLYKRAVNTLYDKSFDGRIPLAHVEVFEDRHAEYAKLFTTEMTWVNASLLGYLSLTKQLNLKDERDRIYAFLELVENEERPIHLRPNYKDHFLHVYHQFAAEYILSTRYIGLLSNVEHDELSLHSGIPSWVPRWDMSVTRTGYAFAPADSGYLPLTSRDGSFSEPTVDNESILSSEGVIIDTILHASQVLDSSSTTVDTISKIWQTFDNTANGWSYPSENRLGVFIGILTAGTREGDALEWLRSMAAFYQIIYEQSGSPAGIEAPSWLAEASSIDLFLNTVKGYTHNRKLMLTERGYIGLASAMAQKGDACGIIFGCTTPCILRGSSDRDCYKYLGAAYIVGQDHWKTSDGRVIFSEILGSEDSKDWVDWDVEERDIRLC
ncbi:hypothetical protein HBI34_071220 [Parastagonospora nodorum]|nr:hypothetical protein HBI34_071220 [Parastagonospora nodorum]